VIFYVKYLLLTATLMSTALLTACDSASSKGVENDDVISSDLTSNDVTSNNHWVGQWRLVNIWAEWCKPCWKEIPELNQFYAAQKDSDIKLLGFNFDELEHDELVILKEKMSIDFPVISQWPEVWTKPDVMGLPATVIIAPDNIIIDVLWGEQTVESLNVAIEKAKQVAKDNLELLAK
jgi:thiol-disulfide isomerase/thioredoxin